MKCQCCDNRIWIETQPVSKRIHIMVKKCDPQRTETGIEMTPEEAKQLAEDILFQAAVLDENL